VWKTIWPKEHRAWVEGLPEQLGPRRFRLLAHAWCRLLLEPALEKALDKHPSAVNVQRRVLAAIDVADFYADTGKTKEAMKQALKDIESVGNSHWPFLGAHLLMVLVLSREPEQTLNQCTMSMQTTYMQTVDKFVPLLQRLVDELTPPEGEGAAIDAGSITPEARRVAQAIYHRREFRRMPELADLLERAGCRNGQVLAHCREENPIHVRGCWVLDEILGDWITNAKARSQMVGAQKRHQILGRELHETLEVTMDVLARGEALHAERSAPGQPHQQFARLLQLEDATIYAVLEHLGYGPIPDLSAKVNQGVDRALDYFFGDWWVGDEDDAKALDKSRPDRELAWYGPMARGLLLAGLTGRWEDAARLCSWVDGSIHLEYRFEMNDYEYQWLYLGIVSSLRPEPLEGIEELVTMLRSCRPKRPRMLCAAWEAAIARDQAAFDQALKESISQFLKSHAQNAPNPNFWVGLEESLVWLIAERNGLKFPTLPEKSDAAIVRRQTVGLATDSSK
jgi:hypothetical protein